MSRWKTVWNGKHIERSGSVLQTLLQADGYDTVLGAMDENGFLSHIRQLTRRLDIRDTDSLYEVGCGAGAVLYPFYLKGHTVSGLDYSRPLIDLARQVMPDVAFELAEADKLATGESYDVVFSFGVFIYFDTYDYAQTVLGKMVEKARKAVGIFDVSDLALKSQAENMRKEACGSEAYEKRYDGLPHLYYPTSFFKKAAEALNCTIRIFPQAIDGYGNSAYRYNVVLFK